VNEVLAREGGDEKGEGKGEEDASGVAEYYCAGLPSYLTQKKWTHILRSHNVSMRPEIGGVP
jgi:hypothetical protein